MLNRFELKIHPPVLAALVAIMMIVLTYAVKGLSFPSAMQIVLASLVFWLGIIIAVTAVLAFRAARTTVHPIKVERASHLVTSGIFSRTRNPMYLGMLLGLVAVAIVLGHYLAALGPVAFLAFITRFQIIPEERAMRKLFGEDFAKYSSQTRRWI